MISQQKLGTFSRRIITTIALSALCLGGVTACGQSPDRQDSDTSVEAAVAQTLPDLRVVTSNPGAEPRQAIAFAEPGATDEQQGDLTVVQSFAQQVGDQQAPVETDPTELTLPFTAKTSADDAGRKTELTLGTPSGSRTTLREEIAAAKGFVATFTGSRSGQWAQASYQAPEAASTGARASIESALGQWLSVPVVFPSEAIGVGAEWTVTVKVNNPSPATRTLTYTLKEHDGNRVSLGVSVEQRPSVTTLSTEGLAGANGAQLTIVDSPTTTEKGDIEVDLTKPLPVAGAVDFTTSTTYGDGAGTQVIQRNRRAVQWKTNIA